MSSRYWLFRSPKPGVLSAANGRDPGNCVSLLRVNNANSSQGNMLIRQESSNDVSGSYVIYAPVDIASMNVVLSGGDPDYVALLPSGFAILPDGAGKHQGGGIVEVGCIKYQNLHMIVLKN